MQFELSVANLPDYPNWKRGIIWGIATGIIFAIIPWIIPDAILSAKILKADKLPYWFNDFGASVGIFIVVFLIVGVVGAFRPQKI